jgi:hypothetical protein
MEGKIQVIIEVMGRWGRRLKQLIDDLKETRGTGSWKRKHKIALCAELALEQACTYHNTDYGMMNEWMKFSQQLLISWWLFLGWGVLHHVVARWVLIQNARTFT